jgi:hypothetical protein
VDNAWGKLEPNLSLNFRDMLLFFSVAATFVTVFDPFGKGPSKRDLGPKIDFGGVPEI